MRGTKLRGYTDQRARPSTGRLRDSPRAPATHTAVAQWTRAPGYEPGGRAFDSRRRYWSGARVAGRGILAVILRERQRPKDLLSGVGGRPRGTHRGSFAALRMTTGGPHPASRDRSPRRSSVSRALASGARGRTCNSCRLDWRADTTAWSFPLLAVRTSIGGSVSSSARWFVKPSERVRDPSP